MRTNRSKLLMLHDCAAVYIRFARKIRKSDAQVVHSADYIVIDTLRLCYRKCFTNDKVTNIPCDVRLIRLKSAHLFCGRFAGKVGQTGLVFSMG